jgi:probable DNA repair protein
MGHLLDTELLNWLEGGGRVVTASERTARALATEYHRTRRARGESAWTSPRIEPWTQFLASCWHALSADGRMVLAPLQEQALWAAVAGAEAELATTLEPSRQRLGRLAMEAHSLLANYAPRALDPRTREGWERDQAAFSRWLAAFDSECRQQQLLSPARLPLEMLALLDAVPLALREPLLVAGFDRLLPVQRQLFDAWGSWQELPLPERRANLHFYAASDESAELTDCARWISRQLERNPQARLLVIAQNQSQLRGQMERIFLEQPGISSPEIFEFSLGVPLAKTALVRSARQLLAWLTNAIDEHALDILLSSGHATASDDEQSALLRRMKRLRERGRQRELWTLDSFLNERSGSAVPAPWRERMLAAQALLAERSSSAQSPLAWAELVPQLLAAAAWPGARPLTSAEYQLHRRLQEALDSAASLGSITRRNSWNGFLAVLDNILMETLYTSESQNAPVLIAGPAETAGLTADAIWFLGATEDGWPAIGTTHPFLPISLQRDARMPHAHPRMDWELAEAMTHRLAASADELVFSYARQSSGVETNPSRLALRVAGPPEPLPAELLAPPQPTPRTVTLQDRCLIPYPAGGASGGSVLITNQSACPFRAFAAARLGARSWDAAEPGLTAAQRGTLLHAVLHAVWSGPPRGIRSQAELQALPDRTVFVQEHVERVFQDHLPTNAREQMPRRYIALEAERLTALIGEWLNFEAERIAFTVDATELKTTATLAGLSLNLRLDRVDRLNDDTLLIVDYKTGDVKTKAWEIPRPEDPQLPLYAAFGRTGTDALGGLVFAKVRKGEEEFAGRVGCAAETLQPGLKGTSALVKRPFTAELLLDWRDEILRLAQDFVAGKAEVDPRNFPSTCEHCALPGLCRMRDFPPGSADEDDESNEEAVNA